MKNHSCIWAIGVICMCCFWLSLKGYAQEFSTPLPTIYITTEESKPVTSKTDYVKGTIRVESTDTFEVFNGVVEIRGRGNSTWNMPKKPYRIKLDKKTRLLNLKADAKSWVLLANYSDKSLMRNALAFQIGRLVGLEFTPSFRYVDLVFNDVYVGNYLLTDHIEVRKNRVPVEEQKAKTDSLPEVSGGYLLEIDGFADAEPVNFSTSSGLKIAVKYPDEEDINTAQRTYIQNHINEFERRLFSADFKDPEKGYRSMLDEHSLINWYIASELTGNSDAFWSTYLYKYRNNDRIFFGPLWDFDIAFNNDNRLGNAERKLMRTYAHENRVWINRIWQDEWFQNAVKERWLELVNEENMQDRLIYFITETQLLIDASQKKNYALWNTLGQVVYNEYQVFPTYEEEVAYLSDYLKKRIGFLSYALAGIAYSPLDDFVPEKYYYSIRNRHSKTNMAVADDLAEPYISVFLWENDEVNTAQHWAFIPSADTNTYLLINRYSALAVAGNGLLNDLIQTVPDLTDKKQIWRFVPVDDDGVDGLINEASGLALDNKGGGLGNGNPVIEYTNEIETNYNQHWLFTKVAAMEGTGLGWGRKDIRSLGIYPNPAQSYGIIELLIPEMLIGHPVILIGIYDLNGRCYLSNDYLVLPPNKIRLFSSSLTMQDGLYLLKVKTEDNSYIKKLMITH